MKIKNSFNARVQKRRDYQDPDDLLHQYGPVVKVRLDDTSRGPR
jgi:hypothetical protein